MSLINLNIFDPTNTLRIDYQQNKQYTIDSQNGRIIFNTNKLPQQTSKKVTDVPITEYQPIIDPTLLDSNFSVFSQKCVTTGVVISEALEFLQKYAPAINWTNILANVAVVGIVELGKIITELAKYKITITINKQDENQNNENSEDPDPEPEEYDPNNNEQVSENAEEISEVIPSSAEDDEAELLYMVDDQGYLVRTDGEYFVKNVTNEDGSITQVRLKDTDITEEELMNYCYQATPNSDLIFNPEILPDDIVQNVNSEMTPSVPSNVVIWVNPGFTDDGEVDPDPGSK